MENKDYIESMNLNRMKAGIFDTHWPFLDQHPRLMNICYRGQRSNHKNIDPYDRYA